VIIRSLIRLWRFLSSDLLRQVTLSPITLYGDYDEDTRIGLAPAALVCTLAGQSPDGNWAYLSCPVPTNQVWAKKEQVAPAIKSVKEERDRLGGLIEAASRSDEDDLALMLEAEELYKEALSVTEPERKRWFIDRLDVRVIVERKGQEHFVTMSCLLGTSKDNSFANISI
jgi:hypothetical protein